MFGRIELMSRLCLPAIPEVVVQHSTLIGIASPPFNNTFPLTMPLVNADDNNNWGCADNGHNPQRRLDLGASAAEHLAGQQPTVYLNDDSCGWFSEVHRVQSSSTDSFAHPLTRFFC